LPQRLRWRKNAAMPDNKTAPPPPRAKSTSRTERLAAALRANLRRRKAQARGRADESKPIVGTGEAADDKPRRD
jgi:uncharacterized protein involved in type VI secretion and phage assembly